MLGNIAAFGIRMNQARSLAVTACTSERPPFPGTARLLGSGVLEGSYAGQAAIEEVYEAGVASGQGFDCCVVSYGKAVTYSFSLDLGIDRFRSHLFTSSKGGQQVIKHCWGPGCTLQ